MGKIKNAVINASPLIFLSRGHHIDLLHYFADEILVPKPVADESIARGPEDETAQAIKNTPWIKIVETPSIPETILYWGLGGSRGIFRTCLCASKPGDRGNYRRLGWT